MKPYTVQLAAQTGAGVLAHIIVGEHGTRDFDTFDAAHAYYGELLKLGVQGSESVRVLYLVRNGAAKALPGRYLKHHRLTPQGIDDLSKVVLV
ncbi:MAG TPA: hypothetical protein VNU97_04825 [Rhizomicrobium sp.]|nr:hypothetical protein [Rhizomicrobium sp.]